MWLKYARSLNKIYKKKENKVKISILKITLILSDGATLSPSILKFKKRKKIIKHDNLEYMDQYKVYDFF